MALGSSVHHNRRAGPRWRIRRAIAKALPHADQVADRWHLMESASRAFLGNRPVRAAVRLLLS